MKDREKRKLFNKVFHGEDLHPPNYCPNCGETLPQTEIHRMPFWVDSGRRETPKNPFKGIGYDSFCPNCSWSGDIIPDDDRDVVHNIDEKGKYYLDEKGRDWHREKEE